MWQKWSTKRVLIAVRTYPTPAKKGVEVSCTAGVTENGQWIRLFPVPYRFLGEDQRFRKYQWIEVSITKASDPRVESYHPDIESLRVVSETLSTNTLWAARRAIVDPLRAHCLCCLKAARDREGEPTLGLFRPKVIRRLLLEGDSETWSPDQLAILRQLTLFANAPSTELEKIPFKFRYEFQCDHPACPGHNLSCTDWELGQSYRLWRRKYGVRWEQYFRQKYETEMILKNETSFYVGTLSQHPAEWIIVGLFYPRLPQ